jgi:ferredoxin-NADP reductase
MTAIEPPVAPARRLVWQLASVRDITVETPRVKTVTLNVRGWHGHRPGQHVDIRLTGKDGHQAQRCYSTPRRPI